MNEFASKIVAKLVTLLRKIARRWRFEGRPRQVVLPAYCAQCGGHTLVRGVADGRISCPQCDQ